MSDDPALLHQRISALEKEVEELRGHRSRGVRKRSEMKLFGLPLYDISLGPSADKNEVRGHARGIIAIGDIATGIIAFGGMARGVVACGGLAIGLISLG